MENTSRGRRFPAVFWTSIVMSAVVLLWAALQWSLVDILTPFLLFPIHAVAGLCFLGVVIWSIVHWIKNRKLGRAAVPTLICAVTVGLVALVPFTRLWIKSNFAFNRADRERIVQMVYAGALRPNVSYNSSLIALPSGTPHVSMGGNEIVVEEHLGKKYVFFYTFRGILDSYAGFLFVPAGGDPTMYSDLHQTGRTQIEKFDEHWFFASHH